MENSKVEKSRPKSGGRKPGTPNRRTAELQRKVEESGITPLEFMLGQMRKPYPDEATPAQKLEHDAMRMQAAVAAAPYVHAKLSAVQVSGGLKLNHESALDELE